MDRSIDWDDGAVVAVDQSALPAEFRLLRLTTVDDLIDAVRRLAVRGAPGTTVPCPPGSGRARR